MKPREQIVKEIEAKSVTQHKVPRKSPVPMQREFSKDKEEPQKLPQEWEIALAVLPGIAFRQASTGKAVEAAFLYARAFLEQAKK